MMPSFRQKFVGFIRQLSNTSDTARDNDVPDNASDCFIQNYLKGSEKVNKNEPVILHGKKPYEIPPLDIGDFDTTDIRAADTGPDGGLMTVNKKEDQNANNIIAGVDNWANPHARAYGKSCSLYEVHPVTQLRAGDPIADCYGLIVREDSALLCLADGVNWGVKASLAAKAAVHGCMDYLNQHIFCSASPKPTTTTEIFTSLLRSFHAAHSLILQEKGMLTTLTAAVVLPLAGGTTSKARQYVVCTCNVGDSLAYVFSPKYGVREITQGSHDVHQMRDMRDALGALGPVDGQNPELSNLTLSLTQVEEGDIVFLTSDGVSDNLDPVVGKFTGLPTVEAHQRHKLLLLRTEDLLRYGVSGKGPPVSSAQDVVSLLLDFVSRLTGAKRGILEDRDLYMTGTPGATGTGTTAMTQGQQISRRRRELCKRMHAIPGKLDHASVAAYVVGRMREGGEEVKDENERVEKKREGGEEEEVKDDNERVEGKREGQSQQDREEDKREMGNSEGVRDEKRKEEEEVTGEDDSEGVERKREGERQRDREEENDKRDMGNSEGVKDNQKGVDKESWEENEKTGNRRESDKERNCETREEEGGREGEIKRYEKLGGARCSEEEGVNVECEGSRVREIEGKERGDQVLSEGVRLNEGLEEFENIDDSEEEVSEEKPTSNSKVATKETEEDTDTTARVSEETDGRIDVQQVAQKSIGNRDPGGDASTTDIQSVRDRTRDKNSEPTKVVSQDRRGKDDRKIRTGSSRSDGSSAKDRSGGSKSHSGRGKDGGPSRRKDASKAHK